MIEMVKKCGFNLYPKALEDIPGDTLLPASRLADYYDLSPDNIRHMVLLNKLPRQKKPNFWLVSDIINFCLHDRLVKKIRDPSSNNKVTTKAPIYK